MRHNRIGPVALAALCSGVLISAQAQTPASPQAPASPQQQSQASKPSPSAVTTIVGCVYRERDVPGRAPNVAERAGVLEDYILAEMGSTPAGTPGAGAPPAPTGTSGAQKLGTMYKLEFAEDEKLRALVGKRVEVTGRVDKEADDSSATPATAPATSQADKVLGRDRINIAEFEVSSIRETAGSCPATPAAQ